MILALLLACRPDPGAPDYPERAPWTRGADDDFYADPLADGEERLGYGLFYEGETTEAIVLDEVDSHFYIYESTFTVSATDDRWEGYAADELTHAGGAWWGGGVHWDVAHDLSGWEALHVALRTEDLADWSIGMAGGGREARVSVGALGLVPDGEWHALEIPLEAFAAADLSAVTVGLLLVGEGGDAGDAVAIDGLYLTRGGE